MIYIKQQNENNIEKQNEEIIDNSFCITGLELINDINNIIKQLNRCFIEYINKSIIYENADLENHFNRKYNEFLDEFHHIYSKIIFRKEENERKENERKQQPPNTIMNKNLIDTNENSVKFESNECKICCCKNIKE